MQPLLLCSSLLGIAVISAFPACAFEIPALTLDENPNTSPPAQPSTPNAFPTGDWFGLRTSLANHGLTFSGLLQLDSTKLLRGGADTDRTPTRYFLDLNATYDASHFLPDATLFLDFQSHDGPNASTTVGDIQGFDNLDAPHFVQIAQLWYQQLLFHDQLRIKAGKIDANADFSVLDHGKEFLHSAASYAVTNFPFVTYPDPAPGAELFYSPNKSLYAGIAAFYSNQHQTVLDFTGHPQKIELISGGAYFIAEAGDRWNLPLAGTSLPGHAGIGAWCHTGDFHRLTAPASEIHGSAGPYLFLDQTLFTRDASPDHPKQNLGAFFTAGTADSRTIPINRNLAAGITAAGFIPARPSDILGLFASWARLSDRPLLQNHSELAIETFYKFQLTPWASLKPDLQYITTPGGRFPNALVATLRAEIDF